MSRMDGKKTHTHTHNKGCLEHKQSYNIVIGKEKYIYILQVHRDILLRVYVCVFSSHSFWTSSLLDAPAGVTQEEGHTGFLIHLLSAVRAFIFLARRIQPFLSLVDCEVEFCVVVVVCCFSHSAHWLPTRKKLLYTVANRARGLLNREKKKKKKCTNDLIVLHPLGIFILFFVFLVRKIPFARIELTSQRVRGLRGTSEHEIV